jgi:hypothetical protein
MNLLVICSVNPQDRCSSVTDFILDAKLHSPCALGTKRLQETRDSYFGTFSCYRRRPNLGTVESRWAGGPSLHERSARSCVLGTRCCLLFSVED